MSDPDLHSDKSGDRALDTEDGADATARGINLWVVYGLMFVAFVVAIGIAILIVLPFYQRR
jgi:hypothetical protein